LQLKNPFPQLPALLAHPAMAALPFHRIDAAGDKWTGERPLVTSGAYRLTDWRLSQQLELRANPHWHGGGPATARIIWKPMENLNSAMRLVLSGGRGYRQRIYARTLSLVARQASRHRAQRALSRHLLFRLQHAQTTL
jgi:oligopeptide transport system substrate-binding protein